MKLNNLYNIFSNHKEGKWVLQPPNPQLLYEFIKTHRIKKVLDLGMGIGCSSAIIAQALKDKGETDFHIDGVENFDKCIKIANELIPSDLKEHITIHKSEAKIWYNDKIPYQPFSIFETLPENDYDFILIDGPGNWTEDGKYIEFPNGDVMKMLIENKIKAGAYIAWDGRLQAFRLLERYYSDNFFLARPSQRDDFNVLERKSNELSYKDEKLENMKLAGYFANEKETITPPDL